MIRIRFRQISLSTIEGMDLDSTRGRETRQKLPDQNPYGAGTLSIFASQDLGM